MTKINGNTKLKHVVNLNVHRSTAQHKVAQRKMIFKHLSSWLIPTHTANALSAFTHIDLLSIEYSDLGQCFNQSHCVP